MTWLYIVGGTIALPFLIFACVKAARYGYLAANKIADEEPTTHNPNETQTKHHGK